MLYARRDLKNNQLGWMYKDKIKKNMNQIPFLTYNVEGNNDSVSQIITFYI